MYRKQRGKYNKRQRKERRLWGINLHYHTCEGLYSTWDCGCSWGCESCHMHYTCNKCGALFPHNPRCMRCEEKTHK